MADAIVEMVVEEIMEESAENAVENVVEEAVENAVEDAVEGDVEEAVENVKQHLQTAVSDLATKDAAKAVKALIREPLTNEIKAGFDAQVRPELIEEAKKAARAEANVVMNSKMEAINRHAAIPVYGISTLESWIGQNVQPIAIRESTKKEAANAALQLPTTQIKIIKISKTASEEMMKKYQTQIKTAAEEVIKQALKSGKKQ